MSTNFRLKKQKKLPRDTRPLLTSIHRKNSSKQSKYSVRKANDETQVCQTQKAAEEVAKRSADRPEIEVDCVSLGRLSLMERLTGSQRVVLIDAIHTGKKPVGTVSRFSLDEVPDPTAGHSTSAHEMSLPTALNVGRSMDIALPNNEDIIMVAIEAENVYDFS